MKSIQHGDMLEEWRSSHDTLIEKVNKTEGCLSHEILASSMSSCRFPHWVVVVV